MLSEMLEMLADKQRMITSAIDATKDSVAPHVQKTLPLCKMKELLRFCKHVGPLYDFTISLHQLCCVIDTRSLP